MKDATYEDKMSSERNGSVESMIMFIVLQVVRNDCRDDLYLGHEEFRPVKSLKRDIYNSC